jgi:hypothetical protein
MSKRTVIGLLIGLLAVPALANAGAENAGTTAANFLSVGSGARILGMGGATLGLGGGSSAITWNPGALGWIEGTELSLSHAGLSEGTSQECAVFGGGFGHAGTHWAVTGLYQSEGSFDGLDATGASTGSFNVSSMALGAQLAQRVGRFGSLGLGTKWVSENLGDAHGSGLTFDGGLLVRAGAIGIGLSAQNLGGSMKYGSGSYPFPSNVGAGLSFTHAATGLRFDVDLNVPSAYYKNVRGGVEWQWRDRFALRGGYRTELGAPAGEGLTGPSFGMGAGAYGLWLDYGYLVTQSGDGQHRMGITFHPGHMNFSPGDPFGQKNLPRSFDDPPVGPPAPPGVVPPAGGKKKS